MRPPEEQYDYLSCTACPLARFGQAMLKQTVVYGLMTAFYTDTEQATVLTREAADVLAFSTTSTYGNLAQRLAPFA